MRGNRTLFARPVPLRNLMQDLPGIVTSDLVLHTTFCLTSAMIRVLKFRLVSALLLLLPAIAGGVTKPHVITFGKWTTVPWSPNAAAADDKPLTLKVRPLLVDARVKEFNARRRSRCNRPAVRGTPRLPHQRQPSPGTRLGSSLAMAARRMASSGPHHRPHLAANLPEFDAFYSAASWYRDYAAYCGVSEDGKKVYAVVAQISRRKPIVKWLIAKVKS